MRFCRRLFSSYTCLVRHILLRIFKFLLQNFGAQTQTRILVRFGILQFHIKQIQCEKLLTNNTKKMIWANKKNSLVEKIVQSAQWAYGSMVDIWTPEISAVSFIQQRILRNKWAVQHSQAFVCLYDVWSVFSWWWERKKKKKIKNAIEMKCGERNKANRNGRKMKNFFNCFVKMIPKPNTSKEYFEVFLFHSFRLKIEIKIENCVKQLIEHYTLPLLHYMLTSYSLFIHGHISID